MNETRDNYTPAEIIRYHITGEIPQRLHRNMTDEQKRDSILRRYGIRPDRSTGGER